ncbi:hypothetical protein SOVF_203540, partial [Spinacia oleracea]
GHEVGETGEGHEGGEGKEEGGGRWPVVRRQEGFAAQQHSGVVRAAVVCGRREELGAVLREEGRGDASEEEREVRVAGWWSAEGGRHLGRTVVQESASQATVRVVHGGRINEGEGKGASRGEETGECEEGKAREGEVRWRSSGAEVVEEVLIGGDNGGGGGFSGRSH